MSLVWEEELEQNPDTAPGVHEGTSSTKGLVLLQGLQGKSLLDQSAL